MAKAPAKDSKDGEKHGEERARDTRPLSEQIADEAAENTLALNPLVGLRTQDIAAATGSVLKALASHPQALAEQWLAFASEFGKIVTGQSEIAADPKDRRFADPAWKSSSLHKAVMQSYVAWSKSVTELVAKTDLPEKDAARARLITSIFVDTMAPSNNPALNPTAIKTLVDTGGKSAVSGLKNFLDDMTRNGGLPSSVDASKFKVGENLANSPGTVVFRNEVLELVHYTATTEKVYQRPLLVVPPQINKYYSVDLSPDKSMIRFLLNHGIQPIAYRGAIRRRNSATGDLIPISQRSTRRAMPRARSPVPTPSTSWAPARVASRCRPMSPGLPHRRRRRSTPSSWRSVCSTPRPIRIRISWPW